MELGFALSSEDHPPNEPVRQAQIAEHAGFGFALTPTTSIPGSASRVTARSSGRRSAGSRRVSTFEDAAGRASHGPDPEPYLELIRKYEEAGFTHVYVHQIGDNQEEFAEFARRELMDRL